MSARIDFALARASSSIRALSCKAAELCADGTRASVSSAAISPLQSPWREAVRMVSPTSDPSEWLLAAVGAMVVSGDRVEQSVDIAHLTFQLCNRGVSLRQLLNQVLLQLRDSGLLIRNFVL